MKLVLPTNRQAVVFVKYSFILGLAAVLFSWLVLKQDPILDKSKAYIKNHISIIERVGEERSATLLNATYVDDAIDYDDNFTPGYNIYRYRVKGATGTVVASVRADNPKTQEYVFSIENINKD